MMLEAIAMKGLRGTVQRAVTLPVRYGVTTAKIHRCLDEMVALCKRWDITPTVAATMSVLDRHYELVSSLVEVDVAVHGFQHVAYSRLTSDEQGSDLDTAIRTLKNLGLTARGFRAPYLSPGRDTRRLLLKRGFVFDSSDIELTLPKSNPLAPRLLDLIRLRYGQVTRKQTNKSGEGGLVELPVSLPDDELLVEVFRIRNSKALFRVFEAMLMEVKSRSSMLVLQIHPERYQTCSDALELVLQRATDEGAWKASLVQAAEWIRHDQPSTQRWPHDAPYALAVTGDLDAAALGDFAPRVAGTQTWKS